MSKLEDSFEATRLVRGACLCFRAQRAARALARRFDEAFRPLDLTNGQFSLLAALGQLQAPTLGAVAAALGMDRTTLTAKLKPMERRGLVKINADRDDRRERRLTLTDAGAALLLEALPLWRAAHADLEASLPGGDGAQLRAVLDGLAQ